jgi:hypothetical protein
MDAIEAVCKSFDPDGMMNPGKLLEIINREDTRRRRFLEDSR